jgi:hypothetical protein
VTTLPPHLKCPACGLMTDHYTISVWTDRRGETQYGTACPTCPNDHVPTTAGMGHAERIAEIIKSHTQPGGT